MNGLPCRVLAGGKLVLAIGYSSGSRDADGSFSVINRAPRILYIASNWPHGGQLCTLDIADECNSRVEKRNKGRFKKFIPHVEV